MTDQELFDFVCTKLIEQGCKSLSSEWHNECAYRGANGTRCAAGWLISDEVYEPRIESIAVDPDYPDSIVSRHLIRSGVEERQLHLVADLQRAHDKVPNGRCFDSAFRKNARHVALKRGLDPSVLAR